MNLHPAHTDSSPFGEHIIYLLYHLMHNNKTLDGDGRRTTNGAIPSLQKRSTFSCSASRRSLTKQYRRHLGRRGVVDCAASAALKSSYAEFLSILSLHYTPEKYPDIRKFGSKKARHWRDKDKKRRTRKLAKAQEEYKKRNRTDAPPINWENWEAYIAGEAPVLSKRLTFTIVHTP